MDQISSAAEGGASQVVGVQQWCSEVQSLYILRGTLQEDCLCSRSA